MNDNQTHLALRQWRAQFSSLPTLVILGSVAALLAVLGPFDTGQMLTLAPRFAYWLVMAASTYSVGFVVNTSLWPRVAPKLPRPVALGLVGLATGIAITPVIALLNLISFGFWPSLSEWPALLAQFLTIALIITIIFQTLSGHLAAADTSRPRAPDVLARLPLDKRGALVAMSSEDHYTRIRTTRGEELVLIRLADAIREAEPVKGLQVHRSHWVALDHIAAARRDGDRAILRLSIGSDIPVSRANVARLREAGLLPR